MSSWSIATVGGGKCFVNCGINLISFWITEKPFLLYRSLGFPLNMWPQERWIRTYLYTYILLKISNVYIPNSFAFIQYTQIGFSFSQVLLTVWERRSSWR